MDYLSFGAAENSNIETWTASGTLTRAHNGKVIRANSGSAINITVPVGLPIGFNVLVIQVGAGTASFVAGSGVTINKTSTTLGISAQYGTATLIGHAANTYVAGGSLT